jgi:23S rRNA (uracil1939-C5)-methyltransferase
VRSLLRKFDISIYDEKKQKGFFRHLLVRHAFTTNQVIVGFVTTNGKFPEINKIIDELTDEVPEIVGIVQNINDKASNVILGDKNKILFGQDYIIEQLEEMKFKISINSFFQVNPIQAVKIYNTVLEYAALTGTETVLDAYSGAGTIALWLARSAKKVIGIEVVKAAVEDGLENARLNNIDNFSFSMGKVEEILPTVLSHNDVDLVILDPPRKGCEDYIFDALADHNIKKVIYVSCNPATLARDTQLLTGSGYKLNSFQPVDMFPHTYHLETVALFCKS